MQKHPSVKGFEGGEDYEGEILEIECDVLIPAAVGGVITSSNAEKIKTNCTY